MEKKNMQNGMYTRITMVWKYVYIWLRAGKVGMKIGNSCYVGRKMISNIFFSRI